MITTSHVDFRTIYTDTVDSDAVERPLSLRNPIHCPLRAVHLSVGRYAAFQVLPYLQEMVKTNDMMGIVTYPNRTVGLNL